MFKFSLLILIAFTLLTNCKHSGSSGLAGAKSSKPKMANFDRSKSLLINQDTSDEAIENFINNLLVEDLNREKSPRYCQINAERQILPDQDFKTMLAKLASPKFEERTTGTRELTTSLNSNANAEGRVRAMILFEIDNNQDFETRERLFHIIKECDGKILFPTCSAVARLEYMVNADKYKDTEGLGIVEGEIGPLAEEEDDNWIGNMEATLNSISLNQEMIDLISQDNSPEETKNIQSCRAAADREIAWYKVLKSKKYGVANEEMAAIDGVLTDAEKWGMIYADPHFFAFSPESISPRCCKTDPITIANGPHFPSRIELVNEPVVSLTGRLRPNLMTNLEDHCKKKFDGRLLKLEPDEYVSKGQIHFQTFVSPRQTTFVCAEPNAEVIKYESEPSPV